MPSSSSSSSRHCPARIAGHNCPNYPSLGYSLLGRRWTILVLISSLLLLAGVDGLRLLQVQVPAEVERGRSAVLGCRFEMQGDTLYSVKWYKGGKEFFRVLPKDSPPSQSFDVEGVHVNMAASNQNQVVLDNIGIKSEGRYKCEVSAEAPNFQTVYDVAEMNVVVPPRDSPLINSPKTTYRIGEEFLANCSSFPSRPRATLTWAVGDKPQVVNEEWLVRYPTIATEGGLEGSVLGLRFRLREEHFDRRGRMQVTCTASVGRMRIDGRTRLNISSADTSGTGGSDSYSSSAPKQRSLILDSRSSAVSQSRWWFSWIFPYAAVLMTFSAI